MICRRALLAGAATLAAPAAAAQKYPVGTKHLDLRFDGAAGVTLSGTLVLPLISEIQRVPGVVLIAGSGPTDRDGNNRYIPDKVDLLKQKLLPRVNMFAYGQVESPYGSGQFVKDLREHFGRDDRVVTSEIRDKDAIVGSIKEFLGKGA